LDLAAAAPGGPAALDGRGRGRPDRQPGRAPRLWGRVGDGVLLVGSPPQSLVGAAHPLRGGARGTSQGAACHLGAGAVGAGGGDLAVATSGPGGRPGGFVLGRL